MEKILDGGSGGKKLWVAENLEVNARSVKRELSRVSTNSSSRQTTPTLTDRVLYELCGPAWYRGLLNDDGAGAGVLSNDSRHGLESGHVGRRASTCTAALRRGVDSNEDHIGFPNAFCHIRREEQIWLPGGHACVFLLVTNYRLGPGAGGGIIDVELPRPVSRDSQYVAQAWFIDGWMLRVPSPDAGDISIDDGDTDMRVLESDDGGGRSTWGV